MSFEVNRAFKRLDITICTNDERRAVKATLRTVPLLRRGLGVRGVAAAALERENLPPFLRFFVDRTPSKLA